MAFRKIQKLLPWAAVSAISGYTGWLLKDSTHNKSASYDLSTLIEKKPQISADFSKTAAIADLRIKAQAKILDPTAASIYANKIDSSLGKQSTQ